MQPTNIGWTDFSSNLIKYRNAEGKIVHACVKVTSGCAHCYSQTLALRWGRGKEFTAENMKTLTPFFDEGEAKQVLNSKKIAGKRVFVNDMTDWMGPWLSDKLIDQCLAVFASRSDVTFQTLTKHAKRQQKYFTDSSLEDRITELWQGDVEDRKTWNIMLPLENVHIGVSVEDQRNADGRIPWLLETPAAIRWASIEPLLAPVDLAEIVIAYFKNERAGADYLSQRQPHGANATIMGAVNAMAGEAKARVEFDEPLRLTGETTGRLDGIVIGGESGAGHREMPLGSAVTLAKDAHAAGVSVFVKQDSGPRPGLQGRFPDDIWKLKEWPTQ